MERSLGIILEQASLSPAIIEDLDNEGVKTIELLEVAYKDGHLTKYKIGDRAKMGQALQLWAKIRNHFSPIDKWDIDVHDRLGTKLKLEFFPSKVFNLVQIVGDHQASSVGNWEYLPQAKKLILTDTTQTVIVTIEILQESEKGWTGRSASGVKYTGRRPEAY